MGAPKDALNILAHIILWRDMIISLGYTFSNGTECHRIVYLSLDFVEKIKILLWELVCLGWMTFLYSFMFQIYTWTNLFFLFLKSPLYYLLLYDSSYFHYIWFTVFCQFLQQSDQLYIYIYIYNMIYTHTHTHTHTHILFLTLSAIMFHHKWLDIVPCAKEQDLIAYPLQTQ